MSDSGWKVRADWHAEVLASGRTAAPGEHLTADDVDEKLVPDSRLIDEGVLIESIETGRGDELAGEQLEKRARDLGISGRSRMNADELRAAIAEREAPERIETGGGE